MRNVLRKPISHSFFSEIGLKTVISHLFLGYFSYCYPLRSTIFSLYIPCVLLFLWFLFQNPVDVWWKIRSFCRKCLSSLVAAVCNNPVSLRYSQTVRKGCSSRYFRANASRCSDVNLLEDRCFFQGALSSWHLSLIFLTISRSTRKFTPPIKILCALRWLPPFFRIFPLLVSA